MLTIVHLVAFQAAAMSASGLSSAILSSVFATSDGLVRPCSQSCRVRTETPSKIVNLLWFKFRLRLRGYVKLNTKQLTHLVDSVKTRPEMCIRDRSNTQISKSQVCAAN